MPIDLWVVQGNLGSKQDVQAIELACKKIKCECRKVDVIPFSSELPDIEVERSVVFYGATNFTIHAYRSRKWNPGVFFDENNFLYSTCIEKFGTNMLNSNGELAPLKELVNLSISDEEKVFVRPNNDLKQFAGTLQPFGELKRWVEKLSVGGYELDVNLPAVLSLPIEISREWRIFVVNRKAIAGSQYREYDQLNVKQSVPKEVIHFVEEMCKKWVPEQVFVMDVAEVKGALKIIELNGFNSSGFYAANIPDIVQAVTYYHRQ
jgi:hypothetical protein